MFIGISMIITALEISGKSLRKSHTIHHPLCIHHFPNKQTQWLLKRNTWHMFICRDYFTTWTIFTSNQITPFCWLFHPKSARLPRHRISCIQMEIRIYHLCLWKTLILLVYADHICKKVYVESYSMGGNVIPTVNWIRFV